MDVIRLLIVDDHPSVREALQISLSSKHGLEVLACDAQWGTVGDCIERVAPDVVLFEPKSLNGHGYETCRRILEAGSKPGVIVLTSYYSEEEALILAELGVSRYLLKDIDSESLYQEIVQCFQARAKRLGSRAQKNK